MKRIRFCFQWEEVIDWGKYGAEENKKDIRPLQDELTKNLVSLAKACGNQSDTDQIPELMMEALAAIAANTDTEEETLRQLIERVQQEKGKLVPNGSASGECCENTDEDLKSLWGGADEGVCFLKTLVLFGLCGMAAGVCQAWKAGYQDEKVGQYFIKALSVLGCKMDQDLLFPVLLELGKQNFKCMELIDKADQRKSTASLLLENSAELEHGQPEMAFSVSFSWQEQRTVSFFLTLLYLNDRDIFIGRKLPFFISSNVLKYFTEHYKVALLSSEEDII